MSGIRGVVDRPQTLKLFANHEFSVVVSLIFSPSSHTRRSSSSFSNNRRSTTMETTSQAESIAITYLDIPLGGRGGAVRFFALLHGLTFDFNTVKLSDWPAEKARLKESCENPCGSLPVVQVGAHTLIEHVATMRYIARTNNLTTGDAYGDFVQDAVADEHHGWVSSFYAAMFGSEDAKVAYKEALPGHLALFEALYTKYKIGEGAYLSTSPSGKGLWADTVLFNLLLDNVKSGLMATEGLEEYPKLKAMFEAYKAEPAVSTFIKSQEA
ncbi:unnamed protein product [Choristocarpus tenellus]